MRGASCAKRHCILEKGLVKTLFFPVAVSPRAGGTSGPAKMAGDAVAQQDGERRGVK